MKDFPYKVFVKMDSVESDHINDWCRERFGPDSFQGQWDVSYEDDSPYNYNLFYYFKNEKDATLFLLKWG